MAGGKQSYTQCPHCGGQLKLIAAIEEPAVSQRILTIWRWRRSRHRAHRRGGWIVVATTAMDEEPDHLLARAWTEYAAKCGRIEDLPSGVKPRGLQATKLVTKKSKIARRPSGKNRAVRFSRNCDEGYGSVFAAACSLAATRLGQGKS